jgi:hypothetical protein
MASHHDPTGQGRVMWGGQFGSERGLTDCYHDRRPCFIVVLWGVMGGKSNKARRKQERLRQRPSGQRRPGEPGKREVCPLYRNPPEGAFYESWVDCGSLKKTVVRAEAAMQDQRAADDPDVHDWARRMPYLQSIYGRMIPVEAAYRLDQYIDEGNLPVQWEEDGPVKMVPLAQMVPSLTGGSAVEARMAIHDLQARGYMMIADDGTVIPLIPAKPDLVDEDEFYDPARYRLARTPRPMTRTEITRRSGVRGYDRRGRPVSGIIWSREEFLALPWVEDYLPAGGLPGSEKDPRGQICERYGERIPADLAVIDMAADDTTVIALANAPRSYVQQDHLCTFAGLDDIREALHHLYDEGLIIPLSNGLILAPSLILERNDAV